MNEKLTCKDLMVGDWVKTENSYAKVVKLDGEHIHFLDKSGTGIPSSAEPISLTEEFFEKNGIKKVDYDLLRPTLVFESDDKRIQITDLCNSGDGYWNVHIDNEDYDTIGGCDVKYVHQFQQLLRLCGYEMYVVV